MGWVERPGRWAALALLIVGLDLLVFGGLLGALLIYLVLWRLITLIVSALRRNWPLCRIRAINAGLLAGIIALSVVSSRMNNLLAEHRAQQIIAACQRYRAASGQFPPTLEALVPAFLPHIPRPKLDLLMNQFSYRVHDGKHYLEYMVIPPFGRRVYELDTARWIYLD